MEILIYQILILVCIVFSAFFSASEIMVVTASRITLNVDISKKKSGAKLALYILNHSKEVLSMILIGNNIVNISASAFITYLATVAFSLSDTWLFVVTATQTIFFLIFCEIFPKVVARSDANLALRFFSYPLTLILILFKPLTFVTLFVAERLRKFFNLESSEYSSVKARDEINVLFKMGEEAGIIDETHQLFVDEILSLHKVNVRSVMTPLIGVKSIEINESIRSLVELMGETKFSRIPVYQERVDNIIGYVYYKDFFNRDDVSKIEDIIRKPVYVPATKKIYPLYSEMQESRNHLVFVVNEYGAVEGLITREDIAEEVVGEIQTQDHFAEEPIVKLEKNKYLISGMLDIDFFSRYFEVKIEKEGFETLAGLVLYHFGRIPAKGESIQADGIKYTIENATEKTVQRIAVTFPKKKAKSQA